MKNRHTITLLTTLPLALSVLVLSPIAQAVSPPPDGYPGGNTAERQNALSALSTETYNAAVGAFSLLSNAFASSNTALGAGALLANTGDQNTATGAGALLSNTTGFDNTAPVAVLPASAALVNSANVLLAVLSSRWVERARQQHHWQQQHSPRC